MKKVAVFIVCFLASSIVVGIAMAGLGIYNSTLATLVNLLVAFVATRFWIEKNH
jgi:hypothetical protein